MIGVGKLYFSKNTVVVATEFDSCYLVVVELPNYMSIIPLYMTKCLFFGKLYYFGMVVAACGK